MTRPDPPLRRIEYGVLPSDATFLEVPSARYRLAREYARTGTSPQELARVLGLTFRRVNQQLARLREDAGLATQADLLSALRTKRLVLVEVHDHRSRNLLARVSPAAEAIERTAVRV